VLRESLEIDVPADGRAFASHFAAQDDEGVVTFPNLGRDAVLVVPLPLGPSSGYSHLASFVRQASSAQNHALWKATGRAMERRVRENGSRPTWLSTAGGGVPWLHVRLDDRPKYYSYAPYRIENVADAK
jgi:hypothetical protein